jgi:hypothetical protein
MMPMRSKADCGDKLNDVIREVGIPELGIHTDPNDVSDDGKGRQRLARWLGPSPRVGQGLCYYLLKPNGRYIAWSTVRLITADDYVKYPTLKDEMKEFNDKVKEHVSTFDGGLILQTEEDDPEEDVLDRHWTARSQSTMTSSIWKTPTPRVLIPWLRHKSSFLIREVT